MNSSVLSLTTICRSQMLKGYSLVDEVPTSIQMQHDEAWKVWPFHLQSLIWEMCVSSSPVQLCTSLLMWAPWLNLAQPAPVSHRNKLRNICACVHSKLLNQAFPNRTKSPETTTRECGRWFSEYRIHTQLNFTKTTQDHINWTCPIFLPICMSRCSCTVPRQTFGCDKGHVSTKQSWARIKW